VKSVAIMARWLIVESLMWRYPTARGDDNYDKFFNCWEGDTVEPCNGWRKTIAEVL